MRQVPPPFSSYSLPSHIACAANRCHSSTQAQIRPSKGSQRINHLLEYVFQERLLTIGISMFGLGLETAAHLYTSVSRNMTAGNFVLSKAAWPSTHKSPLGRTTPAGPALSGLDSEPPTYVLEPGVPFIWPWGVWWLALAESSLASISASFVWRLAKASAEGAAEGGPRSE